MKTVTSASDQVNTSPQLKLICPRSSDHALRESCGDAFAHHNCAIAAMGTGMEPVLSEKSPAHEERAALFQRFLPSTLESVQLAHVLFSRLESTGQQLARRQTAGRAHHHRAARRRR
ncbi:hypothetical protein [Myxococcus sp. AB056]|uniref:hypothetical protein n=1 Tax=Myxococcus sp. AB056 TaxID=2562792 RepID=UPI001891CAA7|nr:hypothetical protein [Myxococcus sp. AB056]